MRPWRLTRRQRVEMEWTLAGLRGQADADKHCEMRLRCTETVEDAAWGMLDDGAELACWPEETASLMFPRSRRVRILRARVAIALRAALRADEDARCEEARAREVARWPVGYDWRNATEAAEEAADALREWPEVRRAQHPTATVTMHFGGQPMTFAAAVVPRALWEAR